jgi:ubiquitin-like modifier-activating enzyme ATG7
MKKLKFHNITSAIDLSFWHVLAKKKLEELRLEDQLVPITGYYSTISSPDLPPVFRIISDSLSPTPSIPSNAVPLKGLLKIFNTKEEFVLASKSELLQKAGDLLSPESIASFILIVYADLKNFVFTYWVGFPIYNFKPLDYEEVNESGIDFNKIKEYLADSVKDSVLSPVFGISETGDVQKNWLEADIVAYLDPASYPDYPSSVLRNILGLLSKFPYKPRKFLSIKDAISSNPQYFELKNSKVYSIALPSCEPHFIGWEINNKGKVQPKEIDLRPQLDPYSLASSAVDLNLKLMRWRMLPDINLDIISQTKCLLLGAGTLGSQISRNLLAWGIKNISFVDSGKVSYSNPVRQSLYEFEDAKNNAGKAVRAASKLKQIFPGVNSEGYSLEIPMPGHSIATTEELARNNYEMIEKLIKDHDVVFLLTDSRESRWLPTVIAAAYDKICLSVALGFDSFLVIRHGGSPSKDRLGCYFCNDVVGPRNSTTDRTLDQQCTVTRPGLSYQASAISVELLVSILQHPRLHKAKHEETTHLGLLPHQIRGNFSQFNILTYVSPAFSKCTGCSERVVEQYLNNGFEFVKLACNDPDYLEDVCDLKELTNVNEDDLIEVEDFE